MGDISRELKELALMSMVTARKQSFCEGNSAREIHNKVIRHVQMPEDETNNSTVTHDHDHRIDSYDSEEDISGGSSEQLSSPGIISPVIRAVPGPVDDSCSTWPRKYNRKASVRFTEDPIMVRQRESRSRLATASSSDWSDITADNEYPDNDGSSEKNIAGVEVAGLVVPDWRKDTPIPVLGDQTMDWKQRENKLHSALEWLRNEIGEMKKQDQLLMCQFIQLRSDIHNLKYTGTTKPLRRGKSNMAGSCGDLIKSPTFHDDASAVLSKFQSTMTLEHRRQDSISEEELLDDDDEAESEMTLTEPGYMPEYRTRTMSLLPPIQQKKMNRSTKPRNMSFSSGVLENMDRGLTDLME